MKADVEICYLCGEKLTGNVSRDHVPPKQFFSSDVRKHFSPKLLTLQAHQACNKQYQEDEDYFVHSLGPLVM